MVGWIVAIMLVALGRAREGHARLRAYYVLRTATRVNAIEPRILFVLDTSGSMASQAQPTRAPCRWEQCEDAALAGTTAESRISAARRAIHDVIASTEDVDFAVMTIEQNGPHAQDAVPPMCQVGSELQRFAWIEYHDDPELAALGLPITRDGHRGAWRLCQGSAIRPYPYLRWDALGVGAKIDANDQLDAPPPSPLVSTAYRDISHASNATRRVQWFPSFVGVRYQPNAVTDPDRALTYASVGDYGTLPAQQDAEVWGHDFYYWPYVDGFPGYAHWDTSPQYSGSDHAGIAGADDGRAGRLFAPFYLDLDDSDVEPDARGPASEAQARQTALAVTSPLVRGGVDAVGGTPWSSIIGAIPTSPTPSNAVRGQTTVSEYLAFIDRAQLSDACAPTTVVIVTDHEPEPPSEGGSPLFGRLASLRRELGARVYVVGLFAGDASLNDMACAAAGACDGVDCSTPCDDAPASAWDTCADPSNPADACAFAVGSGAALQPVLAAIVARSDDFALPSGPASTVNEFGQGDDEPRQTSISAFTEHPSWRGHVVREPCELRDEAGELLPACVLPSSELAPDEETFGPCPHGRAWDAGECLASTEWTARRLYTHDRANALVPINAPDGSATPSFFAELLEQGIVSGPEAEAAADEIAAFVLGRDAPGGWKLPGLARSAPVVVRRIPPFRPDRIPSVAIRDPHCAGRMLGASDGVPPSLEEQAEATWDEDARLVDPSPHYEAQEAVLIGDDLGVLHALQLDSGNELWGFVPRFALASLATKAAIGAASYGQSGPLDEHRYGLAATANHGWVFDDTDPDPLRRRWRQLAIIGMGPGGTEHVVLDVSHMSPASPRGPIDVVWTTEDPTLAADYDAFHGETWARPALGLHVPGEASTAPPRASFVMGSGYPTPGGGPEQGRALLHVDALTGRILEHAVLPAVDPDAVYEPSFGTVVDPAVATHCLSRLWAELQEVYVPDPAGRLFRWDLGRETAHEADSGGVWGVNATMAFAAPIPACEGAGDTCTVSPDHRAETFAFAPAITANDRLDDTSSASVAEPLTPTDQFLVALIGGSPADDALREGPGARYQSSIYLLVDDHRDAPSAGFSVPDGAPKAPPGSLPGYMRVALTDIERTRTILPFAGAAPVERTGRFARGTRPLRAPRIFVTGVVDSATLDDAVPTVIDGVEVYSVELTVYEPPAPTCDPIFYDAATHQWHPDPGATFVITYRLTADSTSGFDFIRGASSSLGVDFGPGFPPGLALASVEQIGTGDCTHGDCGPRLGSPASAPCDRNREQPGTTARLGGALRVSHNELQGFTPVE